MNNATPRFRKISIHLVAFFLAVVGIFFITFSNLNKKSPESSNGSNKETASSNLETLRNVEKITIAEITDTAEITPTGNQIIYLTFDDGPGPYTARLLDVLKKHNVKATFFVTSAGDDALIKREHDEGHTVALHTYSHDYAYVYSSVNNFFADLYEIQARVKNITGETTTLIRFPGGSSNLISARYDGGSHIMSVLAAETAARGFTYFDWNVSSGDAGGASSAEEVYQNVIGALKPDTSVVLQHDIKDFSVDAVERIIDYGKKNGYTFKNLDPSSFTAHHSVNN